jgi:hypothetical protein
MYKLKIIYTFFILLILSSSCFQQNNNDEVSAKVDSYVKFVDSIYELNMVWKRGPDTNYLETPYYPNNYTKTVTDTFVISIEQKMKMNIVTGSMISRGMIMPLYSSLHEEVLSSLPKMNQEQKNKYHIAKSKYDNILKDSVISDGF